MPYIAFLLLTTVLITACGPERDGYSQHGFGYKTHRTTGNPPAKIGEQAWADLKIYAEDTVLFTSPRPMSTVIREDLPSEEPDLLRDAMRILGAGDSATFFLPVTNELEAIPALANEQYLRYGIVVYEVGPIGQPLSEHFVELPKEEWQVPPQQLEDQVTASAEGNEKLQQLRTFINQVKVQDASLHESEDGIYIQQVQKSVHLPPPSSEAVYLRYIGCLPNGKVFSETISSPQAFSFIPGKQQVIKGWESTIVPLVIGAEIMVAIPPELAYGATGKAPYVRPETTIFYYLRRVEKDH